MQKPMTKPQMKTLIKEASFDGIRGTEAVPEKNFWHFCIRMVSARNAGIIGGTRQWENSMSMMR